MTSQRLTATSINRLFFGNSRVSFAFRLILANKLKYGLRQVRIKRYVSSEMFSAKLRITVKRSNDAEVAAQNTLYGFVTADNGVYQTLLPAVSRSHEDKLVARRTASHAVMCASPFVVSCRAPVLFFRRRKLKLKLRQRK